MIPPLLFGGSHGSSVSPPSPWPYPDATWPRADPSEHGMSASALRAVPLSLIVAATVIRHGHEVWTYGDVDVVETSWASCSRSVLTTAWGILIFRGAIPGGMDALEDPVLALGTATAHLFSPNIKLKHLLSYTSQANPPGSSWSYSCREHWPAQHRILEELTGETVQRWMQRELLDVLGGHLGCRRVGADGTNRVIGSCRDMARWGYLWLRQGRWHDAGTILGFLKTTV